MLAPRQNNSPAADSPERFLLAKELGCRAELSYWYGGSAIRPMLGVRCQKVPSDRLISQAAERAYALGIRTLFTEAIPEWMSSPFIAAGFSVVDTLVLMSHATGVFAPMPRPSYPTASIRIVRVGESRFSELAEIDARAFSDFWSLSARGLEEAEKATKSATTFAAELIGGDASSSSGRPPAVGYSIVGTDGRVAYLQRLAVDPRFARRGIGAALACAAIRRVHRSLASVIWVNTPLGNDPAIRLYESLGFVRARWSLLVLKRDLSDDSPPI